MFGGGSCFHLCRSTPHCGRRRKWVSVCPLGCASGIHLSQCPNAKEVPSMARLRLSRRESYEPMLLLIARSIREIAFGFISIVLPVYWHGAGYSVIDIGLFYSVALLGSSTLSLAIGRYIDHLGRKRLLIVSSILWVVTTPLLLSTKSVVLIIVVMLFGSISPTGKEIGLYLGVEQAMLSRLFSGQARTNTYAWFNLVGYSATALGALAASAIGISTAAANIDSTVFSGVILAYTAAGVLQLVLYALLTPVVEVSGPTASTSSHVPDPSVRRLIRRLSALFTLDAFSAGLIIQGILVYWFRVRYHIDLTQLGLIFFGTNTLSALSSLAAARLAQRFGLLNTMVFTHLPSNVLLMLVPLSPNAGLAAVILLFRHLLSQMDVPTRQAYSMAMVDAPDRAYLAAWTNGARSLGTGATPVLSGALLATPLTSLPLLLSGGLKIVYDVALYATFKKVPLEFIDKK